jgi:hypothetical protein
VRWRSVPALLAACALAACGNSGDGFMKKAPNAVLADTATALRAAHSYHVTGMLDPGFSVDVVIVPNGSTGTITTHGVSWYEISSNGQVWFRGSALWRATVSARLAQRYDDNWVLVSDKKAGFGFAGRVAHFDDSVPDVVFGPQQGLTNNGVTTLNASRVVELTSNTDVYDVLVDAPHYPVRWLEKENPGPNGQPCGITLGNFNQPAPSVRPPQTPLELTPSGRTAP